MKYILCALPMVLSIETLSMLCLCAMAVCLVYDIAKHAPNY